MFVSIEGIDGSGKSTICKNLNTQFPDATITREPTQSEFGTVVRNHIRTDSASDIAVLFGFLADHAQHIDDIVRPHHENHSDTLLITDRYIDSRYAYQIHSLSTTLNASETEIFEWLRTIQEFGWSILPDITLYLDVRVESALERLDTRDEHDSFETQERLEHINSIYEMLANTYPNRYYRINAEQHAEETTEQSITRVTDECINVIQSQRDKN